MQMSRLLDEKTVRLLKDPSRGWVITTLQELYKMTKARKFANRYAFYDAITLKVFRVTGNCLSTSLSTSDYLVVSLVVCRKALLA